MTRNDPRVDVIHLTGVGAWPELRRDQAQDILDAIDKVDPVRLMLVKMRELLEYATWDNWPINDVFNLLDGQQ